MKWLNNLYPWLAAITQASQYAHAGYLVLGAAGAWTWGLIGVCCSLFLAFSSSRFPTLQAKSRRSFAWVMFSLILFLSPAMLTPAYYEHLAIRSNAGRLMMAIAAALIPDAGTALIAVTANAKAIATPAPVQPNSAPMQRSAKSKSQRCELCGAPYRSKGAHMRQRHPELVKHKVYSIQELSNGK